MSWIDPKRDRISVSIDRRHVGYVTMVNYPARDITVYMEGTPWSEIVIADAAERHVALLQRFHKHWLIQCGHDSDTLDSTRGLDAKQAVQIAQFALSQTGVTSTEILGLLIAKLGAVLGG